MPASQRNVEPGVIDRLLRQPYRFEFFQAVRLIELWLRQNGIADDVPIPLASLRFDNHLSLAFPASQIAALRLDSDAPITSAASLQQALLNKQLNYIRITPAFIGLLGSGGGLPLHYTERIANYEYENKDTGPRDFLNTLSTRSVALFYKSWTKHRPECMVDPAGKDQFLLMLSALSGLRSHATPATPTPDAELGQEMLAYYAARFRSRCVPASMIAGVLSEYCQVPVILEQLIGHWEDLPDQHQTQLGLAHHILGAGALLGRRIYRRDSRARVHIGPLNKQDFERFLPHTGGAQAINQILAMFCGAGMTFEVHLVLRAQDLRSAHLRARDSDDGARLGFDAFMFSGAAQHDRTAVRYLLRP